jgi:hypothetical protein
MKDNNLILCPKNAAETGTAQVPEGLSSVQGVYD